MSDDENTAGKHGGRWQPGQSGNPAGRPRGSRNKLGESFITELYVHWIENGAKAIVEVREKQPAVYLKIVASLLPKQLEIKDDAFDGLTDEQLAAFIAHERAALGLGAESEPGAD